MPDRLPQCPLSSPLVLLPAAPANHDSAATSRLPPPPWPNPRPPWPLHPLCRPLLRLANRPAPAKVSTACPPVALQLPSRSTPAKVAPSSPSALRSHKSFSRTYSVAPSSHTARSAPLS